MFKKGQLVQSVKYGDLYVVTHSFTDGWAMTAPLTPKRMDKLLFSPERLRLIGNNYQAKPKCSR